MSTTKPRPMKTRVRTLATPIDGGGTCQTRGVGPVRLASWMLVALLVLIGSTSTAQELVLEIGETGSGDGQFAGVNGIDVDHDGRIYAVDAGNARVQVFGPDGSFERAFGSLGVGPGEFEGDACGIVVNEDRGLIYVSEGIPGFVNHRIQVFDMEGAFRFEFGSQGSGDGQFESPCQMAFDDDDLLYVVDSGNKRVQIFDYLGSFRGTFGSAGTGDGEFNRPSGIALDGSGRIWVADAFADRIQVFDTAGIFLNAFGMPGAGDGEFIRPCHLAQGGMLYVADALNERIQVFDPNGNFHLQFAHAVPGPSRFCTNVPTGLASDLRGRIYVEQGDSIRVYSIDRDGDGLLDLWETRGVDTDGDGVVDLPLHAPPYNADPDHKDLFFEIDWHEATPVRQNEVVQLKQTLCAAPLDAGGVANPDGQGGIRLHVDTGTLADPQATERPKLPCSCGDGVDNDGDGLADADDPACLAIDPNGGEGGAGLVTCVDDLDNDGDGRIDEDDPDCPRVYDALAIERSFGPPDCDDGADNDGDGLVDRDDPDCAVGDDLGGRGGHDPGHVVPGVVLEVYNDFPKQRLSRSPMKMSRGCRRN